MQRVTVTRMGLLARKEQIALASQGLELLEQKRTALMQELRRTADRALTRRESLQQAAAAARLALAAAEAISGPEAVRSAAIAAREDLPLEVRSTTIMGVRVPELTWGAVGRSILERGYGLNSSTPTIEETAACFEGVVDQLIKVAESELRLQRLAEEIQRTTRRANALELVVLPQLRAEKQQIEIALDERERADHFRLKMVKKARRRQKDTR